MKNELTVELYAIAAGVEGDRGVGQISHDLQITTETDNLLIPISANILSVHRLTQNDSLHALALSSQFKLL